MSSQLIAQPFDGPGNRIGDHLIRLMAEEPAFDILRIGVAYAKTSGVLRLIDAFEAFLQRGARIECTVGIEDGVTSAQALRLLLSCGVDTKVFHNPITAFHPKVFLFTRIAAGHERAVAIVGSGNLTAGGLYTNYEAATLTSLDLGLRADRSEYVKLRRLFADITSRVPGTCRQLSTVLLDDLERAGCLADERLLTRTSRGLPRRSPSGMGLFSRAPIPLAPPIPAHLRSRIPARADSDVTEAPEPEVVAQECSAFVMLMGRRDVGGNRPGYSPDVFIPLAARDANPGFWGWPGDYVAHTTNSAEFLERRVDLLVQPVRGSSVIAEHVRFYFYPGRSEFRINSGTLVGGASISDLLVLRRPLVVADFDGSRYEYEAMIIPPSHASYSGLVSRCTTPVPRSPKRWGYFNA